MTETDQPLTTASLFSGIGGIERGLELAGAARPLSFCEVWAPARAVLEARFDVRCLHDDVISVPDFGGASLVTAGFPCTDLSQAGLMRGLDGMHSGLVIGVLAKIAEHRPDWVLLENVPNMLHLSRGAAMARIIGDLESCGYRWAYRVVDSRFTGLAQRRRRVLLLASRIQDPAPLLLEEDTGTPSEATGAEAYGFSWTEGNRGLGWAVGATPTLKGGTTVRVPSPPAVWLPLGGAGQQIVRPSIKAAEVLQGFDPGWTGAAPERDRWKLVGNAVSVPVARWVGERLLQRADLRDPLESGVPLHPGDRWPTAARGSATEGRWRVDVSEYPRRPSAVQDLAAVLAEHGAEPLSVRATAGFRGRLVGSSLRYNPAFVAALDAHIAHHTREVATAS